MNDQLQAFARQELKDGLAQLEEGHHRMFKQMYARDDGKRTVEDAVAMDINTVVDEMPDDKLDWAMQQVQRSLTKADKTEE